MTTTTIRRKGDSSKYLSSGSEFRSLTADPAAKNVRTHIYAYTRVRTHVCTRIFSLMAQTRREATTAAAAPPPPFGSSNGILVDVFSAILSRAALRNVYARRRASARVRFFCTLHASPPALFLLSFFLPSSFYELLRRERMVSTHQASGSPLRSFRFPRTRDTIGTAGCLSPCSACHPVEWTIQFLGTAFRVHHVPAPPC